MCCQCAGLKDDWKHERGAGGLVAHLCFELFSSSSRGHHSEGMRTVILSVNINFSLYEFLSIPCVLILISASVSTIHLYLVFIDISAGPDLRHKPYRRCNAWTVTGGKYSMFILWYEFFYMWEISAVLCCAYRTWGSTASGFVRKERTQENRPNTALDASLSLETQQNHSNKVSCISKCKKMFLYACVIHK